MDRLTERDRLAILACDCDGLERAEAARRLGCGEGTLSARLHRGRKRLAELLRARGVSTPRAGWAALSARDADAIADMLEAYTEADRHVKRRVQLVLLIEQLADRLCRAA